METQKVLRNLANRRVIIESIPVEGEALIKPKETKGWLRYPDYIGRMTGLKILCGLISINPRLFVVDDRDSYPLSPYRPNVEVRKKQCITNGDAEMADRQADFQMEKDKRENDRHWYYSSMSLAIMGCVFLAIVMLALKLSGRI